MVKTELNQSISLIIFISYEHFNLPIHNTHNTHAYSHGMLVNAGLFGPQGDGYRRGNDNGFSTTRSVKKVYLWETTGADSRDQMNLHKHNTHHHHTLG